MLVLLGAYHGLPVLQVLAAKQARSTMMLSVTGSTSLELPNAVTHGTTPGK